MASSMLTSHIFTRSATPLKPRHPQISSRSTRLVVRAEKQRPTKFLEVPTVLKPVVFTVASNILLAAPALAGGGKIFDFGLTMPIMAGQFLLLMLYLDKGWFSPVGKILDERDQKIRDQLASVGDNSAEIKKLEDDASKGVKEARAEAQAAINAARSEAQAKMAEKFDAAKLEVDKDLDAAFAALENERDTAMAGLDAQIDNMGVDILAQILPEGLKV